MIGDDVLDIGNGKLLGMPTPMKWGRSLKPNDSLMARWLARGRDAREVQ